MRARRHLPALGGYLGLAGLTLWNALQAPFTRVAGVPHLHVWEELWHFWWTRTALATGRSPFVSDLLGFPGRLNVFYDMPSLSLPFASVPLQELCGVIGAYNAIALLALTAAAFGTYLLGASLTARRLPAFLGGIVYGFSPFLQTELSNGMMENVFAFALLPFFALYLLRINRTGRLRDGFIAGLLAAAAALSSWYFLVVAAPLALLFAGAAASRIQSTSTTGGACAKRFGVRWLDSAFRRNGLRRKAAPQSEVNVTLTPPQRGRRTPRTICAYTLMGATLLLLIAVPLYTLATGPTLERGIPWQDCVRGPLMHKSCIDVLSLFTHGRTHPSGPAGATPEGGTLEQLPFGVYIGKLTLLLALLTLLSRPRNTNDTGLPSPPPADDELRITHYESRITHYALHITSSAFLLYLLLMLGPYLNINGRVDWGPIRIPLLNRLLLLLPGTGRALALHNYRFAAGLMLCAGVLVTCSLNRILPHLRHRVRLLVVVATAWLLLVDFGHAIDRDDLLFVPASDATLPSVFTAIAGAPDGAVFNIPVSSGANARPDIRGVQMYHQVAHRRPIPCDPIYVIEPPDDEPPLIRAARRMAVGADWHLTPSELDTDLQMHMEQGVRFVVVYERFLDPEDYTRIAGRLQQRLGPPMAQGEGIEIYRLAEH